MTRLFVYLLIFGIVLYFLWFRTSRGSVTAKETAVKPGGWFKAKRNPMELWVQVYETSSQDEGRMVQARLQEEDLECILYEQGKKGIDGTELPGIGVAVPRSIKSRAQTVISRMAF